MEDYELRPAPGNPDRAARPSITAQLKEAVRRSEAPQEPDKIKHNKSHEDRYIRLDFKLYPVYLCQGILGNKVHLGVR